MPTPQPYFVPVRPNVSRKIQSRGVSESTSAARCRPLTVSVTGMRRLYLHECEEMCHHGNRAVYDRATKHNSGGRMYRTLARVLAIILVAPALFAQNDNAFDHANDNASFL